MRIFRIILSTTFLFKTELQLNSNSHLCQHFLYIFPCSNTQVLNPNWHLFCHGYLVGCYRIDFFFKSYLIISIFYCILFLLQIMFIYFIFYVNIRQQKIESIYYDKIIYKYLASVSLCLASGSEKLHLFCKDLPTVFSIFDWIRFLIFPLSCLRSSLNLATASPSQILT